MEILGNGSPGKSGKYDIPTLGRHWEQNMVKWKSEGIEIWGNPLKLMHKSKIRKQAGEIENQGNSGNI